MLTDCCKGADCIMSRHDALGINHGSAGHNVTASGSRGIVLKRPECRDMMIERGA